MGSRPPGGEREGPTKPVKKQGRTGGGCVGTGFGCLTPAQAARCPRLRML